MIKYEIASYPKIEGASPLKPPPGAASQVFQASLFKTLLRLMYQDKEGAQSAPAHGAGLWHFRESISDREKKQCFLTARDCGQFRKIRVLLNRAAASRYARFRKTRIVTLAPAGRGSAKLPRRSLLSACGARLVAGRVAALRSQGGGACPRPCVSPPR